MEQVRIVKEIFQSTPPARGATWSKSTMLKYSGISIHAPREGGDETPQAGWLPVYISIHAPREGGDGTSDIDSLDAFISIHAPREGGDHGEVY